MKKTLVAVSVLLAGAFAAPAVAEEGRGSIGIGSYGLGITSEDGLVKADSMMIGAAVVAEYGITDLFSVGGHFYSVSGDFNISPLPFVGFPTVTLESSGFDILAKVGQSKKGFSYFGGLGYFSETQDLIFPTFTAQTLFGSVTVPGETTSNDYSGFLVGYGIGYNWDNIALTWEGSVRDASDYEGDGTSTVAAATGSLNVSYRF